MSKEAAAGDMRMMEGAFFSARILAVWTASSRDSERTKRGSSGYFFNNSWPDSPIKTTCLICGARRIS